MAEKKDPLFTVNAGQILAKLHLAGKTQAPNAIIVNSGMKADGDIKPEAYRSDEKEVIFDLTNKDGKYEVGAISPKPYEYIALYSDDYIKQEIEKQKLTGNAATKREEELKKENDKFKADNEKALEALKKDMAKELKAYFTTFAGKEHAAHITADDVVQMPIKADAKAASDVEVDGFKLMPIDKADLKKQQDEEAKNAGKKVKANFCFKVGYSVDTATM